MKTISTALQTHLSGELTTLAELVKITRRDGQVIAFTTHDADLVVEGVTYNADGGYSEGKELTQKAQMKADAYAIGGMIDSSLLTSEDIEAGLYDHARVDVYLCNWADPTMGAVHLRRGWLGTIEQSGGGYTAHLRGLHDLLTRPIGSTYTPACRHDFCEGACGISAASVTVSGSVTSVTDRRVFADSSRTEGEGIYADGLLTWTSGANVGQSFEVAAWDSAAKAFKLWLPATHEIQVGDAYNVRAGCDKHFSTCRTRFANGANYGGFPYLPGIGKLLDYPDGT